MENLEVLIREERIETGVKAFHLISPISLNDFPLCFCTRNIRPTTPTLHYCPSSFCNHDSARKPQNRRVKMADPFT